SADGDAETTMIVVADPVVIDPEVSVSPGEVTVSELAGSGVTVSGSGFAPDASVSLTVGGVSGGSQIADADGNVSFVFTGDLAAGSHAVVLSSADGDAETTMIVVADPVVIDPEVSVSPGEVTVSELAGSGVTVSGTGFAADASVSLTVGGVDGGSQTADADGNVSFVFTGELAAGSHAVVLSSADADAETTLTVVEDAAPGLPEQIPVEAPSEDELTADNRGEVSVPETADEGAQIVVRIGDAQPGDVVGVWLFSTPQYLGTFTVSDDLTATVTLPQSVTGLHRIAVYSVDEVLQGWDEIIIAPVEDTVPVPEDGESQLPATGGDSSAALGAALVLLLGGALMLFVRRLRPTHRG
ncbi:MAG: LPXTG cell wall anchor domain-containing protein, partial [Microbacterium sp.]|uniref:LPXTG cell wall anchor domain-containing protein n=1 Tax=Microbacterium sp. TaxID=51671 RepID=UPI003F9669CC